MVDTFSFHFKSSEEDGDYWETRKKFPSGMTAVFRMEFVDETDDSMTFNVDYFITRKRNKRPGHREVTGKDGLEPAIWALEKLEEFEKHVNSLYEPETYSTRIEVGADDDRRWKIYERVLTRRGYNATMVEGNKTLVKRLERNA